MARRVLVKVGGETLLNPADRERLARDLHAVWRSGAQLCVVHGGGPQITELAQRLGLASLFRGGRRVTDAPMLSAVAMALLGQVGADLLSACLGAGVPAVCTPAASSGCIIGVKRPPRRVQGEAEPVDFGLVADVSTSNSALLEALWGGGFVPLLSSLVADAQGQLLNLNADALVTGLVEAAHFDDVVLVTGVSGVYGDLARPETHIASLEASELPGLLASGSIQGGMIAKLEEVGSILKRGAKAVWIVGYKDQDAIACALQGAAGTRTVVRADPGHIASPRGTV